MAIWQVVNVGDSD